jgi:hypothetical protein
MGEHFNQSYICPDSHVEIVNRCDGEKGVLVSYCPVSTIGCLSLSLSDQTIDPQTPCVVLNETMTEVKCQCNIKLNPVTANNKLRRLQTTNNEVVDDILYESGALTMGLMVYYVASEFKNTFNAAPNALSSVEDTQRVLIVMTMFMSLWSIGGFFIAVMVWRQYQRRIKFSNKITQDATTLSIDYNHLQRHRAIVRTSLQSSAATLTAEQLRSKLAQYVFHVIPTVFTNNANASIWMTIKYELSRHHIYWKLWSRSPTDRLPVLMVCQILTSLTLTFFLLAILYDLQGPDDDGSCQTFVTQSACLKRKSLFDSTKTYCKWIEVVTDNLGEIPEKSWMCMYNEIDISFEVMNYCAVVGSVFTALIMRPVDYLFLILSSPLKDYDTQPMKASTVLPSSDITTDQNQQVLPKLARRVSISSKFIPEETHIAHNQAVAMMNIFKRDHARLHHVVEDIESSSHAIIRSPNTITQEKQILLQALMDKRHSTRQLLQQQTGGHWLEKLRMFDETWDLDSTTGCFKLQSSVAVTSFKDIAVEDWLQLSHTASNVLRELQHVKHDVEHSSVMFRSAVNDEQRGIDMLHLFILDLLGRDTAEANIYREKVDEDYTSMRIVGISHKVLCAFILIVLNVFFIYFAMLRGYQKGINWQQTYLRTCVIQLIVDILIFQTCECLYVNVFLPRLVSRKHLDHVRQVLENCIQHLCESRLDLMNTLSMPSSYAGIVNVPDHLFVSTNVANAYPVLLESAMILAYRSYVPNECLSDKWRINKALTDPINQYFDPIVLVSKATSLCVMFTTLEVFGKIPIEIQKMFIRFIQPMLLSGAIVFCFRAKERFRMMAIFVVIVGSCSLVVFVLWRWFRSQRKEDKTRKVEENIFHLDTKTTLDPSIIPITTVEPGVTNMDMNMKRVTIGNADECGDMEGSNELDIDDLWDEILNADVYSDDSSVEVSTLQNPPPVLQKS